MSNARPGRPARSVQRGPSEDAPPVSGEVFRVWLPGPLALQVREISASYDGLGPMLRHIIREWLREHRG